MSVWRRKALEWLPECHEAITSAESVMLAWIDIRFACEDAYHKQDVEFVDRVFKYARWCLNARSIDTRTAVALCFYEHLPDNPRSRQDMPNRLSIQEFEQLRHVYEYWLKDDFPAFEKQLRAEIKERDRKKWGQ